MQRIFLSLVVLLSFACGPREPFESKDDKEYRQQAESRDPACKPAFLMYFSACPDEKSRHYGFSCHELYNLCNDLCMGSTFAPIACGL